MQSRFSQTPLFRQYVELRTKSLAPLCFSGIEEATDLHHAPRYQSRVSYGEGNTGARDYSEATGEQIDEEVRRLLVDAYQLARTILMGDRDKLEGIAKGLLEYKPWTAPESKKSSSTAA